MKKTEHNLIQDRNKKAKQLKVWAPTSTEFLEVTKKQWFLLMKEFKKATKEAESSIDPEKEVVLAVDLYKKEKYFMGLSNLFGECFGNYKNKTGLITLYMNDILTVNYFQKDLTERHIYFILEHELKHYLGQTHEDMENIKDFGYPV